jgi:hypothetical protein
MVIIPTTSTDGHSQPVAITGQEGQDPDDPPIPRHSSSTEEEVKQLETPPVTELTDTPTTSNSITVVNSRDDWGTYTGDADIAHVCDNKDVARYQEVDPVYVERWTRW